MAWQFRHPAQVRDVASAVAWVQRNIHQYGGDGANLFLCGHSAGAHLAMLAAAQPRSVVGMPVPLLVGAV